MPGDGLLGPPSGAAGTLRLLLRGGMQASPGHELAAQPLFHRLRCALLLHACMADPIRAASARRLLDLPGSLLLIRGLQHHASHMLV